jgi:hypothetical protein
VYCLFDYNKGNDLRLELTSGECLAIDYRRSINLGSHDAVVSRGLTALESLNGPSDEQESDNFVASAHATDENDLDSDIRSFKLKHHLKPDAILTLVLIEKDHTVTLPDGLVYGFGDLEPVEVYASDAYYMLDGELIPLPSVLESRTWISKVNGGDTVMMTKDAIGEINTVDIFGANGSNEYMAAVRPGLLATIKPDDLDPESLKKATMSDVSFSEDEDEPYERALLEGASIQDRKNLWTYEKRSVARAEEDVGRGGRFLQSSDCSSLHVIEVAIAFDSTFCVSHDGGRASRQEIERIVARSSLLYGQQGVCAKLVISHLEGFCTDSEDPYRAGVDLNDIGCQSDGLLNVLRDFWNANRESVRRDAAHLFYARDLAGSSIGCASTRTLCSSRDAYGANEMGFSSDEQRRAILFAHELGHNVGALQHESW